MNFRYVGRCRNCRSVWQAKPSQWSGVGGPKCPDCGGRLERYDVPAGDRAAAIADHVARGGRNAD